MKTCSFFAALFVTTMTACVTFGPDRNIASNTLVWTAHPCGEKPGIPYRKYTAFALSDTRESIFGRSTENSEPILLKEKSQSDATWIDLQQFFHQKGILAACGTAKPSAVLAELPPGPVQNDVRYTPPITSTLESYYAPLDRLETSGANSTANNFKIFLKKFLSGGHVQALGKADQLVEQCPATGSDSKDAVCVKQRYFSYEGARKVMFGDIALGDLRQNADGKYQIFDYYCQTWRDQADFIQAAKSANELPGPGNIVTIKVMNTEHTWPQSKFPHPKGSAMNLVEKTDLHHIYPTDTKVNALRGNHEFAEVDRAKGQKMMCADGYLGGALSIEGAEPKKRELYFEPPTEHKGNTARSLFYFSTRYNVGMSALQEAYLRKWNNEDPPDERELHRNEALYQITGVRNPFVDHPDWVARVSKFCRALLTETQPRTEFDCP